MPRFVDNSVTTRFSSIFAVSAFAGVFLACDQCPGEFFAAVAFAGVSSGATCTIKHSLDTFKCVRSAAISTGACCPCGTLCGTFVVVARVLKNIPLACLLDAYSSAAAALAHHLVTTFEVVTSGFSSPEARLLEHQLQYHFVQHNALYILVAGFLMAGKFKR